ncbi:hypothetical protein L917_07450, partial [Phytophthora nicotianae]
MQKEVTDNKRLQNMVRHKGIQVNVAPIKAKIKVKLCNLMSPGLAGSQHVVLAPGGCWHASAA